MLTLSQLGVYFRSICHKVFGPGARAGAEFSWPRAKGKQLAHHAGPDLKFHNSLGTSLFTTVAHLLTVVSDIFPYDQRRADEALELEAGLQERIENKGTSEHLPSEILLKMITEIMLLGSCQP